MVWSGDGAVCSVVTDAGSPTESALPQPTVAKHVTSALPAESGAVRLGYSSSRQSPSPPQCLQVPSVTPLRSAIAAVGRRTAIVAADMVIDDVISVTKAAVENSPAQRSRGRGKAGDQSVLLDANGKRWIHTRCFTPNTAYPPPGRRRRSYRQTSGWSQSANARNCPGNSCGDTPRLIFSYLARRWRRRHRSPARR